MKLIAYHNDQSIKNAVLLQLQGHYDADQIIKGLYWQEGKGCAVGCAIHSNNPVDYENLFGIPVALARLEDTIFDGLPNAIAKDWPIRFMTAIQPGMDLSLVSWKFLYWLLTDETVNPGINHPLVKDAVARPAQVICAISKGEMPNIKAARSAAKSTTKTALAAESAARLAEAAWSTWAAWAVGSAESEEAARLADSAKSAAAALRSAAQSARSAESAAAAALRSANIIRSATLSALAARAAAWSAEAAAWSAEEARLAAYIRMADKLIELLGSAPMANALAQEPKT